MKKTFILYLTLVLSIILALTSVSGCSSYQLDQSDFHVSAAPLSATDTEYSISNGSGEAAYVRFCVIITWEDATDSSRVFASTPVRDKDYSIVIPEGMLEIGDYFYICSPVESTSDTEGLSIKYLGGAPDGFKLGVKILPDAISASSSDKVEAVWGVSLDASGNIQK